MTHTPHHEPVLWRVPYLVALMNAEQLTVHEMGNNAGRTEYNLWCAVLMQMVGDAKLYWKGKTPFPVAHNEQRQAFDDLLRCGPMLRHVCKYTGHDAQWLSEGFARWCERDGL
jgi:hypothetical protein